MSVPVAIRLIRYFFPNSFKMAISAWILFNIRRNNVQYVNVFRINKNSRYKKVPDNTGHHRLHRSLFFASMEVCTDKGINSFHLMKTYDITDRGNLLAKLVSCGIRGTPRSRCILEKLTVSQIVKKFPAFYGTQRFRTAFTRARHLSLSWASSIQSMSPSPFLKIHFNTILPSMPGSPKWSPSLRPP
jgi:hypothetical protein